MIRKNRDKLLGVAALVTFFMAIANTLEYFVAGKNYLLRVKGVVEQVEHRRYTDDDGDLTEKTVLYLAGYNRKFYLSDKAMDGGYLVVEKGDTVELFTRRWWQFFYNFDYRQNVYYVKKNEVRVYNNLSAWKGAALAFMCVCGGCAFLLTIMYLDQVKNISVSNLFFRQRKRRQ